MYLGALKMRIVGLHFLRHLSRVNTGWDIEKSNFHTPYTRRHHLPVGITGRNTVLSMETTRNKITTAFFSVPLVLSVTLLGLDSTPSGTAFPWASA